MTRHDEDPLFWANRDHGELTKLVAELHRQRNTFNESMLGKTVFAARKACADMFIGGVGLEIGAGSRPWPLPENATCRYGDVLDDHQLKAYHQDDGVVAPHHINGQTMEGISRCSLDFIISAHVLEHLRDPLGALLNQINCLKHGGVILMAVPDMRYTWDRDRPLTTLKHFEDDLLDGGKSTLIDAYTEHLTYVHPLLTGNSLTQAEISRQAEDSVIIGTDIHYHTWTTDSLDEMLARLARDKPIRVHGPSFCVNENIVAIRKM